MKPKHFLMLVLWMFGCAAGYALLALVDPIRTIFLQWLCWFALLMAPGIYISYRALK